MQSDQRGTRQTAYQILVGCVGDQLWTGGTDFCGIAARLNRINPFMCLMAAQHLPLVNAFIGKYRVWDEAGQEAESSPAWWEMGLLERTDWQAQWIGAPFSGGPRTYQPGSLSAEGIQNCKTGRFLRACMRLPSVCTSVTLMVSRVGDALLTPGWTDYNKHIQYQVYDVTELLQAGHECLWRNPGRWLGCGAHCLGGAAALCRSPAISGTNRSHLC